ncbi:AMP-binding protein [Sphingomonas bacterium]|uniref:AMP-binding protein n=1 Tax=Sphingomonas bacterium TaxID=1895847 RepID=UPI0015776371|nr:AMP-binding protein [Sphingomonas bacterium]
MDADRPNLRVGDAGYAALPIRPPKASVLRRGDGTILIEQAYDMPPPPRSIPHLFQTRAHAYWDRPFVARRERLPGGALGDWQILHFGDALQRARALAQALIDRGLGPDASLMVLSGPSAEHMLFILAAQMARAPYAPISSNFSLWANGDFAKLRHAVDICRPRLVFADDAAAYRPAMQAIDGGDTIFVTPEAEADGFSIGLDTLLATDPGPSLDASIDAIVPDTHAKTIFTSGSTGRPKAVIQTQRMLCAVIQQHDTLYIRDAGNVTGDAYLSWMPWSHVGPNNILIGDVINDGAALYIDDGRPIPGQFEETIRNLHEIHPHDYGSPPIFFMHLAAAMEADPVLRDGFFSRLKYLHYATAGLSQDLFDRLQRLAVAATGAKIPIITKYGATETQGITLTSRPMEEIGPIGLPFPGVTVKLAPVGDRLEIRVKGDTVTPGYLGDRAATDAAFDEEGFYRTGDAAVLTDPDKPGLGISFDGRVSENFKLASGTWVAVGPLRLALIEALAPIVQEAVITGENREDVGALLWLRPAETLALADSGTLGRHSTVRAHLQAAVARYNTVARGSSRRVARLLVLDMPPAGEEIAEKGYVNQRAVQRLRPDQVARLYAAEPDDAVILA